MIALPGTRRQGDLCERRTDVRQLRWDLTEGTGQATPVKKERLMRSLRYSLAVPLLLGAASWGMAAEYTPKDLLKFRPTQPGVDYETPTDVAALDACKVELVTDAQKRTVGYALRDGQGKLLRRFVITSGGKYLNQWSYFQDGFEVYRENDLDGDRSLDECRWLNSGGTRVATIKGG